MKSTHYALETVDIAIWINLNHPNWQMAVSSDDITEIKNGDHRIIRDKTPKVLEYLHKIEKETHEHS